MKVLRILPLIVLASLLALTTALPLAADVLAGDNGGAAGMVPAAANPGGNSISGVVFDDKDQNGDTIAMRRSGCAG